MDKFIPNGNYLAIRTLCKPISKDFVPSIRIAIIVPWNKFKGLDVFSVIRLKCEVDVLIETFLKVLVHWLLS